MTDQTHEILLKCVYCFSSEFILPNENYEPKSGDRLRCANCGRINPYDSLMRVANEKIEDVEEQITDELVKKFIKDLGL